jgi:hypothetical protein
MAQDDTPAVIVGPSENVRAELVRVVGEALGFSDVLIAEDALTRESSLFIERRPARDATGQRLSGRDYDRPERFDLVKQGNKCLLVHVSTSRRFELEDVRCETKQ